VNVRKKEPEEINMMAVFPVILASCHWPVYHQKFKKSQSGKAHKKLCFFGTKETFRKSTVLHEQVW
jgi:hypothetical protein